MADKQVLLVSNGNPSAKLIHTDFKEKLSQQKLVPNETFSS